MLIEDSECCDLSGLFQRTKYSNYLGLCRVMKMFDRYGTAVKHKAIRFYYNLKHTVEHAMNCPTGGFPIIHHNELHDFTASLVKGMP